MTQTAILKVPDLAASRYELKAIAKSFMLPQMRMWLRLHAACFVEAFPPRQVNNAYLDTYDLASYTQNLAGVSDRSKVRLRWYGAGMSAVTATFEVKRKRNRLGWKLSQRLPRSLHLDTMTWQDVLAILREDLSVDFRAYLEYGRTPVVIIQYQREYYVTFDGSVRATLDHGITSYDQRVYDRPNMRLSLPVDDILVVELKAASNNADHLQTVAASMPIRMSKSSKYAEGVATLLAA